MERAIKAEGQVLLGWRDVPVNRDMPMSPTVREAHPAPGLHRPRRRRHRAGRAGAQAVRDPQDGLGRHPEPGLKHSKEYYVPSMSSRTVVYKGLLLADQVGVYYRTWPTSAASRPSAWCTSASPPTPSPSGRWPTRYVAHNGEINTVRGNYNWMLAREGVMASPVLGEDLQSSIPSALPASPTPPPSTTAWNC
jgi:glutamate synthase (NADPH/NADH) large chain